MSDVAIYTSPSGSVEVRLEKDTVWLRREQMAELFGRDRTVIGRHIRNVFAEAKLDEESNVQNLHIAGSDKPVGFYNLDVIISVGDRVNSAKSTRFRQWATCVLRQHLTQGYTFAVLRRPSSVPRTFRQKALALPPTIHKMLSNNTRQGYTRKRTLKPAGFLCLSGLHAGAAT